MSPVRLRAGPRWGSGSTRRSALRIQTRTAPEGASRCLLSGPGHNKCKSFPTGRGAPLAGGALSLEKRVPPLRVPPSSFFRPQPAIRKARHDTHEPRLDRRAAARRARRILHRPLRIHRVKGALPVTGFQECPICGLSVYPLDLHTDNSHTKKDEVAK